MNKQMKHTQGPWEVCEHSWSDTSVVGRDGRLICCVSIDSEATEETQAELEEQVRRNFALIAAAPNLLELLRMVCDSTAVLNHLPPEHQQAICDAIAKATGSMP